MIREEYEPTPLDLYVLAGADENGTGVPSHPVGCSKTMINSAFTSDGLDWQQWAVVGIVLTVVLLFARSAWLRHRGRGGGCGSCSCSNSALKKANK
jgi:hypothetical protein